MVIGIHNTIAVARYTQHGWSSHWKFDEERGASRYVGKANSQQRRILSCCIIARYQLPAVHNILTGTVLRNNAIMIWVKIAHAVKGDDESLPTRWNAKLGGDWL